MKSLALIVDDEADLCRLMQTTLTRMGIDSHVAYNLKMADDLLAKHSYNFCLTDLALPDGSGIELVKKVVASSMNTPIAVITAHGTVDLAIEAMKLGAFDFVNKPLDLSRLRKLVESALKVNALKAADESTINTQTVESPEEALLNSRLIGTSAPIMKLKDAIKKLARSQAPVFLWGESGTGKEVVAKLIHELSPRREGNFVPVNCGAIPSELMESEFFGHKKGSFTGATADKIGLFQQASGGTLFLDEIADLPLAMQVKLLRAIQEKTVRAIGDTKETPVDIRLLSATHKDLTELVQAGSFRQDLFYRINVIMVQLPTLNERKEDIDLLATHFLSLISNDWGIESPILTPNALEALKNHNFEGNVRELRNLLERAITLSENNQIEAANLFGMHQPPKTTQSQESSKPALQTVTGGIKVAIHYPSDASNSYGNATDINKTDESKSISKPIYDTLYRNPPPPAQLPKEGLETYLQNQEKHFINIALSQADNNKTLAAKLLGMSFRSLRYRMKKLELDNDD